MSARCLDYSRNHFHFITTSAYRRARLFDSQRFPQKLVHILDALRSCGNRRKAAEFLDTETLPRSELRGSLSRTLENHPMPVIPAKAGILLLVDWRGPAYAGVTTTAIIISVGGPQGHARSG